MAMLFSKFYGFFSHDSHFWTNYHFNSPHCTIWMMVHTELLIDRSNEWLTFTREKKKKILLAFFCPWTSRDVWYSDCGFFLIIFPLNCSLLSIISMSFFSHCIHVIWCAKHVVWNNSFDQKKLNNSKMLRFIVFESIFN